MTNNEFSDELDVIYENINKGGAVGLDPYEKSVILTHAQERVALDLASRDVAMVSPLVRTAEETPISSPTHKIDNRSIVFELPDPYMTILNETVISDNSLNAPLSDQVQYTVVPLQFVEYQKLMSKPYSYPRRRTAWRLINAGEGSGPSGPELYEKKVEILMRPNVNGHRYRVTYLRLPQPIILENLTDATIRGIAIESTTNMLESTHPAILDYASKLAEQYYYDKYSTQQQ